MAAPGIGQNTGVNQSLPKTDGPSTQSVETGQASFGSGTRDVKVTEPAVSLMATDAQTDEVGDMQLSERSVKDASTGKKGYLRKGWSLLTSGAGKAWETTKTVAKGTSYAARHPIQASKVVGEVAFEYARDKYSSAKAKGSALRAGIQEFRSAPKATVKKGLKSLKERAISLPDAIKTRLPSRPRGVKLPVVKSLFRRSAKSVPPTPSASVKTGMEKVSQVRSESAESTKLESTREFLESVKVDLANLKTLNKLLDDPTSFFKSGTDVTVRWGESTVSIQGEGLERAAHIKEAVSLAIENHVDIREALQVAKSEINQLKSDKKAQKSEVREAAKSKRKEVSKGETAAYKTSRESLDEERKTLKSKLQDARQTLTEVRAEHRSTSSGERDNLKSQAKADKLYLNELTTAIEQASTRADAESLQAAREVEIARLETNENQMLDELNGMLEREEELEQAVREAKDALSENTRKIDDLQQQHRVDQKAIKKS